ncbi:MAG: 50S ribosomal protein L19e [Methanobacteriota archaeon]|nr:MAG: 50S ribosomal protein L19e [Euryarchaeota archaeon]
MSDVRAQRRIAAELMKVGVNRVLIKEKFLGQVALALTREDVGKLISRGAITKRRIKGTSRRRSRERHAKYKRGQRRGPGSRKGTKNARESQKRVWINKIRAQRKYLRKLRDEGYLTPHTYRKLYLQAKGNLFRSVRYLHNYIAERDLAEKKLPPFKR